MASPQNPLIDIMRRQQEALTVSRPEHRATRSTRIVGIFLDGAKAPMLVAVRGGLATLAREVHSTRIPVGTACSGSDLVVEVAGVLQSIWTDIFDLEVTLEHKWSCEKDETKAKFIKAHFSPEYVFADIEDMAVTAYARAHGISTPVPVAPVSILICGSECDSVSLLNKSARTRDNVQCVEKRREKTGRTAGGVMDLVKRARPRVVIMENVRNLSAKAGNGKSNMDSVVEQLKGMDYVCATHLLNAINYGVPQSRERYPPLVSPHTVPAVVP